jgi:hypothetical protein
MLADQLPSASDLVTFLSRPIRMARLLNSRPRSACLQARGLSFDLAAAVLASMPLLHRKFVMKSDAYAVFRRSPKVKPPQPF